MSDLVLTSPDATVTLVPHSGGRLASLRVGDLELLGRGGSTMLDWGCYPMAPYAGRIRRGRLDWAGRRHQLPVLAAGHAIHGVTLDRPWQVVSATTDTARLRCGFDRRWPLGGHAELGVELSSDRLRLTLEVHAGDEPMPAWSGLHPWFRRRLDRGGDVVLGLEARGMLERGDDGLPTGAVVAVAAGPYDDCFVDVVWPVTLTWPNAPGSSAPGSSAPESSEPGSSAPESSEPESSALRLEIDSDAGYAVVFDQKDAAVCVEPQTAPPDAARLGRAHVVQPGAPLVLTTTFTWSSGAASA